MKIVIDWPLSISFISLLVSGSALYWAHLRGPRLSLALPGPRYPCQVRVSQPAQRLHTLEAWLLIANTGVQTGLLFRFRLDPVDEHVRIVEINPSGERGLPLALAPGEGRQMTAQIEVHHAQQPWEEFVRSKDVLQLQAVYTVSATLGRVVERSVPINLDLTRFR